MQYALRWLKFLLAPIPGIAVLYLTEGLIQYNWLGRDWPWPITRLWVNLLIVSVLIGACFIALIKLLAFVDPDEWVWGWLICLAVIGAAYVVNKLCSSQSINWPNGQQAAYGAVLLILSVFYLFQGPQFPRRP